MSFWKPGTVAPGIDEDRDDMGGGGGDGEGGGGGGGAGLLVTAYNAWMRLPLAKQRLQLPIWEHRRQLLYCVERHGVTIVVGSTGSGKSTQIPQYLAEAGWAAAAGRRVVCTQPRRVAAVSLAARVAAERGDAQGVGHSVGYAVRFDERVDAQHCRIKYVTDGMLVREAMLDPLLTQYSVVMLDEAHERSLHSDILFTLLKKIRRQRPELRIVVSSATLDARAFQRFFAGGPVPPGVIPDDLTTPATAGAPAASAPGQPQPQQRRHQAPPIISVGGRLHPVHIAYTDAPVPNYVTAAIDTVLAIHATRGSGDVLVFLTGRAEIEHVCDVLNERGPTTACRAAPYRSLLAVPLYSSLPEEAQTAAMGPGPVRARKVVCATNVAETSVTIEGIVYVVDSGFVKLRAHDARSGSTVLGVCPISRASADQRAGRAGRVQPGQCYRLYPQHTYDTLMEAKSTPDVQRIELSPVVLQLKALGIDNVVRFHWMSPPPAVALAAALTRLVALGALDAHSGALTQPLGAQMAEFPTEPRLARVLLGSGEAGCSEEVVTIVAMLSVHNVFVTPPGKERTVDAARRMFAVTQGDHLALLNVYNSWRAAGSDAASWAKRFYVNARAMQRAKRIRHQLRRYLLRFGVPLVSATRGGGDGGSRSRAVVGPEPPPAPGKRAKEPADVRIRRCFVAGFFGNAVQLMEDGSTYRSVCSGRTLVPHPTSVYFKGQLPQWAIYHEEVHTSQTYARDMLAVDVKWLTQAAPHFFSSTGRK